MATLQWYAIFVVAVAFIIAFCVHYSSIHLSDQIRKLIIILSFFIILGITTYPGDPKQIV